jgi:ABC-type uncharacterized transport system permease subunit
MFPSWESLVLLPVLVLVLASVLVDNRWASGEEESSMFRGSSSLYTSGSPGYDNALSSNN